MLRLLMRCLDNFYQIKAVIYAANLNMKAVRFLLTLYSTIGYLCAPFKYIWVYSRDVASSIIGGGGADIHIFGFYTISFF